jgi:hypothetical protein
MYLAAGMPCGGGGGGGMGNYCKAVFTPGRYHIIVLTSWAMEGFGRVGPFHVCRFAQRSHTT